MIYSQFHTPPMHERFSGLKGFAMFAAGLLVLGLSLMALPFILLAGAVTFVLFALFGRFWLGKLRRQMEAQQQAAAQKAYGFNAEFAGQNAEQSDVFVKFRDRDSFRPRPHKGETFEHDPLN
ncbi:hypothetical protein KJI95_11950 [Shewanella sp. JM162201]|uniref:Uncharacterized protein n=1 Tax=Shewanella jiangmenensis TaxID=2837387 RepID=A0ABS5V6A3_9GAMM|nr:hypothetical protein [Shewanella jiangmenensis]MBT1445234.1 hypothetical protein [Shewanella jiangmenensis]